MVCASLPTLLPPYSLFLQGEEVVGALGEGIGCELRACVLCCEGAACTGGRGRAWWSTWDGVVETWIRGLRWPCKVGDAGNLGGEYGVVDCFGEECAEELEMWG